MTTAAASSRTAVLTKGGASLLDLLVDVAELRIIVTGPRMLFDHLNLLTTLSPFEGCTAQRLKELADSLEGTIHCGLVGIRQAEIEVTKYRSGAILQIGLGPASMYQSELVLRTRTGETLAALITRLLHSAPSRPFFVGLHGVPATGHLEHHHPSGGDGPDDGHGHHGEGGSHGRP